MADIVYPCKGYNYKVLIEQKEEAGFSEVSAPDITSDPAEYREGNMAGKSPGKQSGILKYCNVTLKRGTTESQVFVRWMKGIQNGKVSRKMVVITLMDDEMKGVASWQLEKAWPTKYTAPDFNATSNKVAIESLELVCEGISRIK